MPVTIPKSVLFAIMAALLLSLLIGGVLFRFYLRTQAIPPETFTY